MALSKEAIEHLRKRMVLWNSKHPVDLVWRRHFEIPFGSPEHLQMSMFDQQIWFEEHKEIEKFKKVKGEGGVNNNSATDNLPEDTVSSSPMSQEEIEEAFDNMDLEALQQEESVS